MIASLRCTLQSVGFRLCTQVRLLPLLCTPRDLCEIDTGHKALCPVSSIRSAAWSSKLGGEIAVEVPAEQLPGTDDTDEAFGLTREQLAALRQIWYEDGHYSGGTRLWELLRRRAEAEGKPAFYGIRLVLYSCSTLENTIV